MSEHKKFQDQKLLEEIIKDALDEQQVQLTITYPLIVTYQSNYEEMMGKLMEFIIVYGKIESRFEIVV